MNGSKVKGDYSLPKCQLPGMWQVEPTGGHTYLAQVTDRVTE